MLYLRKILKMKWQKFRKRETFLSCIVNLKKANILISNLLKKYIWSFIKHPDEIFLYITFANTHELSKFARFGNAV